MNRVFYQLFLFILAFSLSGQLADGQESKPKTTSDRIASAAHSLQNKQQYLLQYKLKKDETVRWTVEHVGSTKTQMAGELEETSMRSQTQSAWRVSNVDALGNMTFVHMIEAVNMWHKIGEADPVAYNSKTDTEAPEDYQAIAENIGKPMTVFSITPNGLVQDRKSNRASAQFGTGEVTIPLPEQAIPIGHKWYTPKELQGKDEDGRKKVLKARVAYELAKVKDGNAYIAFRTEVLTPVESQSVKSQIMQQMTKGYLVFDLEAGRPLQKETEWDETVQGFQGPDSYLQYIARMTEKLVDGSEDLGTSNSTLLSPLNSEVADKNLEIKTRDGKPLMRK